MLPTDPGPGPRTLSAEALFRFLVVSLVVARLRLGEVRARAVAAVAEIEHHALDGTPRQVSGRTLYRWLAAFDHGGAAALEPAARPKVETSAALPEPLVAFLRAEKTLDARASVPELLARARERGVLDPRTRVARTTVWRAIRRMGLPTRRCKAARREGDTRRFRYPNRMMMMLADGKHFRAGAARLRRVALVLLDDATRYAPVGVVGTSESTELFLWGVYELIRRVGFFDVFYLDRGPGFRSDDTAAVMAHLPHAHLVLGTTAYPEGHGAIEKFHQLLVSALLRGLDGAVDVDPDCGSLTLRLQHYLDRIYNDRPHEALGHDTPRQRWERDERPLRFPQDDRALREYFVITEPRDVSADHVIRHGGRLYEAPRGLARQTVEVRRQVLDGTLSVLHRGRLVRLHEVDLAANARDPRAAAPAPDPQADAAIPRTAAMLAFDRQFGPVVGPDGGCPEPRPPRDRKD